MSSFGSWREILSALEDNRQKIKSALKAVDPATRGMRQAFNTLKAAAAGFRKHKGAAASVLHSSKRKALNAWLELHAANKQRMQMLRRAGAALRHRGFRQAIVSWKVLAAAP